MPTRNTGLTIADALWLEFEPTSKAHLARCMAHLYEYQAERGTAPLPNLDVFLVALARPRWEWTPQASTLFRRISSIIQNFRRSSPVQMTQREILRRRRAALRGRFIDRPMGGKTSEATVSMTEGSVRCSDEWSEAS